MLPMDKSTAERCACSLQSAPEEACDPAQWLFLDTETTGLTGGTGTYPFMVGIAWWDAGGLEVEQFFMRDHSEEHSLLVALAERIAERGVLVTFNGKSFDWPLLETRYRMTRKMQGAGSRGTSRFSASRAEFVAHPAWIGAPRGTGKARSGISSRCRRDFRDDSAILFRLSARRPRGAGDRNLQAQPDGSARAGGTGEPHHFPARRAGEAQSATRWSFLACRAFASGAARLRGRGNTMHNQSSGSLPAEADRLARRALARMAKRDGDLVLARELWESMVGNSREGFEAFEQLAIYHEHAAGEPHEAAVLVKHALGELRKSKSGGVLSAALHRQYRERFEHRLARLERKAGKTLLDGMDTRT